MPPLPAIQPWTNQDLHLFHGTTVAFANSIRNRGVNVGLSRDDCDFGLGFYCTTIHDQAALWARKKARQLSAGAAIVRIVVPRERLAALDCLSFVVGTTGASDFWSLVAFCRNGGNPHGRIEATQHPAYDVVFGPVAIWKTRQPKPNADQVSFHTEAAQHLLNLGSQRSIIYL